MFVHGSIGFVLFFLFASWAKATEIGSEMTPSATASLVAETSPFKCTLAACIAMMQPSGDTTWGWDLTRHSTSTLPAISSVPFGSISSGYTTLTSAVSNNPGKSAITSSSKPYYATIVTTTITLAVADPRAAPVTTTKTVLPPTPTTFTVFGTSSYATVYSCIDQTAMTTFAGTTSCMGAFSAISTIETTNETLTSAMSPSHSESPAFFL